MLKTRVFALGKDCVLELDGQEIEGVADVSVRETIVEMDATGFNHSTTSSVVVMRSYEIQILVPDMKIARGLYGKRWSKVDGFMMSSLVDAKLSGGIAEIKGKFTIHDIDADESLDGAVIPRFLLRSWGHENTKTT